MFYCKECGERLKDDQKFCTSCGHMQDGKEKSPVNQPSALASSKKPRQPMSTKKKVIVSLIAVIAIALFGTHQLISSQLDPMKKLQAMDRAMSEGDSDAFLEHIDLDKEALLNEEQYFAYINDQGWEGIREQLAATINSEEQTMFDHKIYSYNDETLFQVKRNPVAFGLYTSYTFEGVPNNLVVSSNMDETDVNLEEVSHTLEKASTPKTVAKLYPGTYTLTGKAQNEYGDFTYEEDLYIAAGTEQAVNIEFPASYYQVGANVEGATLVVNGEKTGKTLEELGEIGPFPEEQEVEMYAEWKSPDGETFQSATLTQDERDWWGGLHFIFDEEVVAAASGEEKTLSEDEEEAVASTTVKDQSTEDAEEHVLQFRNAYENALNTKDYSKISSFLDEGSEAGVELEEYINDLENKDYNYDFTSNEIIDVVEVGDDTVEVSTNEQFIFTNHLGEQIDYNRDKVYTMQLVGDSYKISEIEYSDTDRTER